MDFTAIGSLHAYTKNMAMEMKWQQKRASGNFKADGTKTVEEWLKKQQEEAAQSQTTDSKLKAQIDLKLKSGKKLTYEELEYLKNHDPQSYQKAREIQMEREAYEQDLKRCKTKEDVQRLKMKHVAASLSVVTSVENNPNIPKGQKLGIILQENQKMNAITDATNEFVKEGGYSRLPTEAEKAKAEQDQKEAEMAEKGLDKDGNKLEDAEKTETSEEESSDKKASETKAEASRPQPSADTKPEPVKTPEVPTAQKDAAAILERELTRQQAESTPEALKVKRAKAQAAYARVSTGAESLSVLDLKK